MGARGAGRVRASRRGAQAVPRGALSGRAARRIRARDALALLLSEQSRQLAHFVEDDGPGPFEPICRRQPADVAERPHAGRARSLDADPAVLDDGAPGWLYAHLPGRVQEEIRGGLTARHFAYAEGAVFKARPEAGQAERQAHLFVAAAGRHACGNSDPVECLDDAVHRRKLGLVGLSVEVFELALPVSGKRTPEVSLDFLDHVRVRPAYEALDHLGFRDRPAKPGEDVNVDSNRDAVAVDQDPVAIEDDQFEQLDQAVSREKPAKSGECYSGSGFSCTMDACRTARAPVEVETRNGADTPSFATAYAGTGT